MNFPTLALAAGLGFVATAGAAATVSFSDSIASQPTAWNETLSISQFDTGLGNLTGVTITLTGSVTGDANAESLDGGPAIIVLELSSMISASTASLGNLASVLPLASTTFMATAYDGTIDFAPGSGVTNSGLTAVDSTSATLTGGDMAEFIGSGMVDIELAATGAANASGAGNLITQFSNFASATLDVTYTYDEIAAVPLPASGVLLLAALGGIAGARRKLS